MLGISIEQIGQTHQLPADLESAQGPDLNCYCKRCEYKREMERRVSNNFYYGIIVFPLWIINILLYLSSFTLDSQFEFSEEVQNKHRDEITLLQPEFDDPNNLVSQLVMWHELQQKRFDKWVYWSVMGLMVDLILFWLIIMTLTNSQS